MLYLVAALHVYGASLTEHVRSRSIARRPDAEGERGSVTLEQVLLTIGLVALAGLLVVAVKAFLAKQTDQLK